MSVRLVCTSKRRVEEIGIAELRTWPSSMTSPVRTSRTALSTDSGFMWLPDPRSSVAPHFDGHRWPSAGGRQDGPWAAAVDSPSATITAAPMTMFRMVPPSSGLVVTARASRDLDDARLDGFEPFGDLWVVAGDDQLRRAREGVDRLEGREHLRQIRDDLDRLSGLDVVVEVRGVGGEDDGAAPGLDGDDLEPGGVAADAVDADAGPHLVVAVDDPDLVRVVQGHQSRQRVDVGRPTKRRSPAEGPRPERHFLPLDPELRIREQAVSGPVVVVKVSDERNRNVAGLDARALDHRRGAHVVSDAPRARVVVEESRVYQERMGTAEDQPHEIVERELLVRGLAVEEQAFRRVPLPVLDRKDFVHD